MSSPAAVAQTALDDAMTAAFVGDDMYMLRILLSALHHIASGGKRDARRWQGLRADPNWIEDTAPRGDQPQ